jgi:protein TonB
VTPRPNPSSGPAATAEPATPPQPSSPAPPDPGSQAPAAAPSAAWRHALAAWLLAHKTYPDSARQRGIQGTVGLRFTVDQTGRVVALAISRSSGSDLLDDAAEAMLRNATLPAPDPAQDRITVTVQLLYTLTDR